MLSAMTWDLVAAANMVAGFFAAVLFILYYGFFFRSTRTASCSAS